MNLWNWLTGRDLEQADEAPQEPADADPWGAAPLIPQDEPRQSTSTSERKSRGSRARIELEQTDAAFDHLIRTATKNWAETGPLDTDKREEAYRLVHVIRAVRTRLRDVIEDGEMAAAEERALARRPADNR